ncbi:MAG: gas vesicle protein GvpG [Ignavibacteria bacterium]|jgi:hypothetical protein
MFLIDDILLAPLKGVVWLAKELSKIADKELNDEDVVKEKLMALQLQFQLDEIDEEEYNKREAELLDLLNEILKRKSEE